MYTVYDTKTYLWNILMLNGKLHILKLKESNDSVPWATKEALLQGWVQMMQGDVFKV